MSSVVILTDYQSNIHKTSAK